MLSNIGRAAIKRIGGSHLSTNRFLATIWQLQRVEGQQNAESNLKAPSATFLARRLYATVTKATQTKTKTTTAKKPATKAASAKKPAAAKKLAAKKPANKAAKKPVKKPAKKPVKKPVKKKVKAKAKPKPKKKVAKKVVLTDSQKLRKQLKELKIAALLSEGPKRKPETAFQVLFLGNAAGSKSVTEAAKASSVQYKAASTAELEKLNHTANENRAANLIAYKKWVESHTPDEIRLANLARRRIRRLTKKPTIPKTIKDDRAVKSRSSALSFFLQERLKSGDFAGIKPRDCVTRIAEEYKELSPEKLKRYLDIAAADSERYFQEYKTVYKHDAPTVRIRKAQA